MSNTGPGARFMKVDLSGGNVTISPPCRALIIGTGGIVNGKTESMADVAVTAALPAGWHPIKFSQINQSGTTAGEITAVW